MYTPLGTFVSANFASKSGQISVTTDDGSSWQLFVTFTTDNYLMKAEIIYDNAPFMAVGSDGIMLTWVDTNTNAISCFIPLSFPPSILPPVNLKASGRFNQFPFQFQAYVSLNWAASPSDGIIGYHVFRNGTLLASTPHLNYIDTTSITHTTYTYEITAYDGSNNESAAISAEVTLPYN